ncbi:MAG: 6-phosphogluconolactonase [Pseudomonadota bacterium]
MSNTGRSPAIVTWAAKADAHAVADHIAAKIMANTDQWFAVPGGNTPLPIFENLSKRPLPWNTVSLVLTDDRMVPEDHPASNQGKLLAAFKDSAAHIHRLEVGMMPPTFDMVWLGMGTDGHIASLFPNIDPTAAGEPAVINTTPEPLPPEAPFERVSLNMAALINAKEIVLVVKGAEKKRVLDEAIAGAHDLPISRLFAAARCPITIFWSRS